MTDTDVWMVHPKACDRCQGVYYEPAYLCADCLLVLTLDGDESPVSIPSTSPA